MEMEPASAESLLPIEVWGKIFQNSEERDAWNFRQVCSAWRKELNDHYDKWTVRLHQHSPYFQNSLQLKVKEATIWNLSTPVALGQEETPRLFKHPELLQKLSIPKYSPICRENMVLLLNSCGKTIKHLDLVVGYMDVEDANLDTANNLYPNGIEFTNLESLTLDFPSCLLRPVQELILFKRMVGLSTMSKIKSLTVRGIDILCNDVVFSTILAFIAKNGTNLEIIKCNLIDHIPLGSIFEDNVEPAQAQLPANANIDLALLRQVLRLRKIEIHYNGIGFNPSLQIPCETLLEAQRNLTDLNLKGIHICRQSLRRVCYNNQNTLTNIYLRGLDFNIDLAILAGCMHLKELYLFSDNQSSQEIPALQNAQSLPVGIRKFESHNYSIQSEDILYLFTGHGELVDMRLHYSGSDGSNGITAAVFALFLNNRNSSNKLRDVHISGFHCSSALDLADFKRIVRGLEPSWCHGWENVYDFRYVGIRMERTMGTGGDWSGWKTGKLLKIPIPAHDSIMSLYEF